jgi:hypothetical protein
MNDVSAPGPSLTCVGAAQSPADWPMMVFQPNATSVNAGFFSWEVATGQVVCDPVTYQMHGLPADSSATIDTFLARVPPDDLPGVVEAMEKMLAACDTYQIEYRIMTDDGTLRSMEARGRVLAGPDGKPARMVGLVMDTTDVWAQRDAEGRRLRERTDRALRTYDFTANLASAVTVDAIVATARDGLRAYGADSLIIVTLEEQSLVVVAAGGFEEDVIDALITVDPVAPTPLADAISWRAAVILPSAEALVGDYPHLGPVVARSGHKAWAALPVTDSKGGVGGCMFGFPASREFTAEERALLYAVSGLLAQSLERARMYESEHALATELQQGLLPRCPLAAPGVSIATRYQPATSGLEIGGDFYDAIQLSGGRVALVIGDVQGHNLIAASMMGRLRTAVHAYAREGHSPAAVMAAANNWLADLNTEPDISLFATCCFVVLDPATGKLSICRAGHPPPALVTPSAPPRLLSCVGGLPLGVIADADYETVELTVPPGSVLVLTTDGLLEGDVQDYNVRCVLGALEHGTIADLETLADEVLASPRRRPRHGDDVALLIARLDVGAATR